MNHVRSIKEILNIPTGNRNVAVSNNASLTDSQLFFGSQFWLENSQSTSQDVSLSSRNSQQSSQEGSEPKLFNSYHTKPLLFGDFKDKSRGFGLLEKFEEDRRKAREKNDSDLLAKEFQHIRETLSSIQRLVTGTERNTAVCQAVFEQFDSFTATLQNTLEGLQTDISQKFETLVDKLSTQKELMTGLQEGVQKHVVTTLELQSQLQSLKNSLKEENKRETQTLEEAVKLLNSLVSKYSDKPITEHVMDSAIQTSPVLEQSVFNLQGNQLEEAQSTCSSLNPEQQQVVKSLQVHKHISRRRRATLNRRKKRPLVLPQSHKLSVSDENSQPGKKCSKQPKNSKALHEHCDQIVITNQDSLSSESLTAVNTGSRSAAAAGRFITPLSCWSQDSNSSECFAVIEPIIEKLSAESKTLTPVKHGEFWQLFDSDLEF